MEDDSFPSGDDFAEDKRLKQILLIDTITTKCASSSHEILQQINHAINVADDGSKLEAKVLSGGYTNFSYKVYVDKHPELCVFAKFCFEFAMWNPDKSARYDLQRVENEYAIMEKIAKVAKGTIVAPLALWNVCHEEQNMKLLVTEWSKVDEQFCNQFIEGAVDLRLAPKIADTLANLHNVKDFDPSFNDNINSFMDIFFDNMIISANEACKPENQKDRTGEYCVSLGEEVVMKILNAFTADYHQRDCLIHGDSHVFNILVEPKLYVEDLDQFGPDGTFVLCDWEMAIVGPLGRDIGLALPFPVGCMIAHALNGRVEAYTTIDSFLKTLIDNYLSRMAEDGRSLDEILSILRIIAGTCGNWMYTAYYVVHCQDFFPVESNIDKEYLWDALGILGWKLMRLAYDTDYGPASLSKDKIHGTIFRLLEEEVSLAQSLFNSRKAMRQPRKSSMLRAANHRVSDTATVHLMAEHVRRSTLRVSNKCEDALLE